tara:strand:- start:760 stop:1308 length:549 start_codon:yes stop_codon:yes gene_type:complete
MKRLLLAPLLIALAGCSSDLVVKTDLDEKFIVKESTVTLFPKGSKEIMARIESSGARALKRLQACRGIDPKLSDPVCNQREDVFLSDRFKADIKVEPETVHWIEVKYRPIFIDINKDKSALGYESIACPNPKLKLNTFKAWNYFGGPYSYKNDNLFAYKVTERPINAIEKVQKKICDKYAKF